MNLVWLVLFAGLTVAGVIAVIHSVSRPHEEEKK